MTKLTLHRQLGSSLRARRYLSSGLLIALAATAPAPTARAQCTPQALLELIAPGGGTGPNYGADLALFGDTLLSAGAPSGTLANHAYFHRRDLGGSWVLTGQLAPSLPGQAHAALAIEGDTAAVAGTVAQGESAVACVYVLHRNAGGSENWGEVKTILNPSTGPGLFGTALAISGDRLLISTSAEVVQGLSSAGVVHVYERGLAGPGDWSLTATLNEPPPKSFGYFGSSMDLSGDEAIISAYGSGRAYVFKRDKGGANVWGKVAVLDPPGASLFFGAFATDRSADTAVIGEHGFSSGSGAVYVFERDFGGPQAWGLRKRLSHNNPQAPDHFGVDAAIDGDWILAGAPNRQHNGFPAGSAYLFYRHEGGQNAWGQVDQLSDPLAAAGDSFGLSVGLDGVDAAVAAPSKTNSNGVSAGSVLIFDVSLPATSYCTPGVSASGCQVALSTSGTPSATATSGFFLQASSVEGGKSGLFFFGTGGRQSNSWGNGSSFQCVVPPVTRAGLQASSGTAGNCDGSFSQDLNAGWTAQPNQNPGAGALVQAQLWYRDPQNTSNQTTSLSDAVEFSVCP